MKTSHILCLATFLHLLHLSSLAHAGYDLDCSFEVKSYPADGAAGIPLNTILVYPALAPDWKSGSMGVYGDDVSLTDDKGTDVPLTAITDLCEHDLWPVGLMPKADLLPNTRYTLEDLRSGKRVASFTTGAARDTTPPTLKPGPDDRDEGLNVPLPGSEDVVMVATSAQMELGARCIVRTPSGGTLDMRYSGPGDNWWLDEHTLTALDGAGNKATAKVMMNDAGGCGVAGGHPSPTPIVFLALLVPLLTRRRGKPSGPDSSRP